MSAWPEMLSSCSLSGFPVKWPEDHHWCSMCVVWFVRVLCISHRHGARSWMLVPCGWSNIIWIDLRIWVTFVLLFFKPILWLKCFTLALWTFYRLNWCLIWCFYQTNSGRPLYAAASSSGQTSGRFSIICMCNWSGCQFELDRWVLHLFEIIYILFHCAVCCKKHGSIPVVISFLPPCFASLV